jgi:hypothetical protein
MSASVLIYRYHDLFEQSRHYLVRQHPFYNQTVKTASRQVMTIQGKNMPTIVKSTHLITAAVDPAYYNFKGVLKIEINNVIRWDVTNAGERYVKSIPNHAIRFWHS